MQTIEEDFERIRIPRCDVVSASFALHHIPTGRRKAAVYKHCFASLRHGGMLVSADCYLAADGKMIQPQHIGEAVVFQREQKRYQLSQVIHI